VLNIFIVSVGRETIGRRFRDARQRDESDSGSHPGESGLRGPVPAAAIITRKSKIEIGRFFAIIDVAPDSKQITADTPEGQ
jgi:hypothetical protein